MVTKTMWGTAGMATAFVVLLGGCGVRIDYLPLNAPPREMHARLPAEVDFFDGVEPSQPYVEVATIDARRRQSSHANKEELFAQIRETAARHGCDGVKVIGSMSVEGNLGYRSACIVYRPSAVAHREMTYGELDTDVAPPPTSISTSTPKAK